MSINHHACEVHVSVGSAATAADVDYPSAKGDHVVRAISRLAAMELPVVVGLTGIS